MLKNSNVRKIFCLYDSYVDLHVSVIFAAAPRVVMVYPSILGRGRDGGRGGGRGGRGGGRDVGHDGGRNGGRDGSGGGRLGIQRQLGGRGFGRGLNGRADIVEILTQTYSERRFGGGGKLRDDPYEG